jgi:hypothetical protein
MKTKVANIKEIKEGNTTFILALSLDDELLV